MSDKSFPNHRTIKPILLRWASLFFLIPIYGHFPFLLKPYYYDIPLQSPGPPE
nr:MAG TPA: hypothetical protein [Caudoviricetes sp.]